MSNQLGMIAVVRNDQSIPEWVAYHRHIGFDEFIIIDDSSDDGTWEALQYMALAARWVTARRLDAATEGLPRNISAYRQAVAIVPGRWKWFAIMDIDEYLVTANAASIKDLLSCVPEDVSAVALNWKCFGVPSKASGMLIERVIHSSPETFKWNLHYKCIIRADRAAEPFSSHRPSIASGRIIHGFDREFHAIKRGKTTSVNWNFAWLNHYRSGSLTSWIKRMRRGIPGRGGYAPLGEFREFVLACNKPDITILSVATGVRAILDELEPGWFERTGI